MAQGNIFFEVPSPPLDFTSHDSGDASPLEDHFFFWFRITPSPLSNVRGRVTINSGTDGDFSNRAYFDYKTSSQSVSASVQGVASLLEIKNAQDDILDNTDFVSESDRNNVLESILEKGWISFTPDLQFMSIPKKLFVTEGSFSWATVHRISFSFTNLTAGQELCIGDILLVGGGKDDSGSGPSDASRGGVQGTYRYRVTFRNTTTGNRSNPGPVTQIAKDVNRGYVQLTGLPTSSDSQVDAREIWRTMGDGTKFYKIDQIDDNSTTTYDDQVADYAGLDSSSGSSVMTSEPLLLDNNVPDSTFDHHIIDKLTAFWISSDSGKAGRVYFSPAGRPESQKGFFDVSSTGDPLQRLVIFQGVRYVFSESKLYRLSGDEPYIPFEITGVPGVPFVARRTVVSTPYGIFWQSHDGIRLYNGSSAKIFSSEPLLKIFRGESAENLSAFEGTIAAYARGEYYISDGSQCLAVEVETGAWRHVGFDDISSLFYEWDDDVLQGGRATQVELLEEEGTTSDDGSAIAIEWETTTSDFPQDAILFAERIFIDIDTNGQTITPLLVHQYDTDTLTTISNSSRSSFEREIQELVLRPSVRLTGELTNKVTLYDIEIEYRQVSLGINVEGGDRAVIPGRWREDLGDDGRIVFEIDSEIKLLDQTDNVFVLDRLTIEADTEGTTVTPRIQLENNTVTLSALSTSTSRIVNTYNIDRIGALNEVSLDAPFFVNTTRPKIYRIEAHMRELTMGINITTTNQRQQISARCPDPDSSLIFEVQPIQQMFNNLGSLYFIERIVFETDTNGTSLTPTINIGGGSITLDAFSTTSREYTEVSVERVGPIEDVTLAGDFTGDVQIFGVEIFLRPVELGIKFPDGNRIAIDGKAIDAGTKIVFDVDPADRRFDAFSFVPLIERVFIETDSDSTDITTKIVMENQTVTLDADSTSARDTLTYDVNHIGKLTSVELEADFVSNDIALYGVEIQMRHMPLGVNIITNS